VYERMSEMRQSEEFEDASPLTSLFWQSDSRRQANGDKTPPSR